MADSREVTRLGLRTLLEKEPDFRIVGEAADGLQAVRETAAGRHFLSPSPGLHPLETYLELARQEAFDLCDTLTGREREVLHLAAEGKSSAEIGRLLSLSPRTVETHRANMMHKLCLRNEAELVRYAMKRGILPE